MGLIDEKLLIEDIRKYADSKIQNQGYEEYANGILASIGVIEERSKVREWIRSSERMPEKATEVIACDADGVIVMGYLHKWRNEVICKSAPFITHNILAWMPLPEPYKSGN